MRVPWPWCVVSAAAPPVAWWWAGAGMGLPVRSPACVFHLIEGAAEVRVAAQRFTLAEADTCIAPGFSEVVLHNPAADRSAFLFLADESPLQRKLGVYESRG